MREMGPHSQGDSRRLYRWRDIASNTRGRISDLAVPLATLLRKRVQLHIAGMRPRQEVAIGVITNIAQSDFRRTQIRDQNTRQLNTRFAGCG
jgi:hypothetical protein